ncbi:hypothetical protein SAMN05421688_3246 [Poseidonocella pacifica]|uniref:Uncharacterized protein n=1 Tax=Poseidonocella pacifica TaxID=871651 RepID=A0A1I0YNG7_9RHOB|nr:hypothetical protein [Poseidonocella pacifica]SFB14874.1 hypothetical protein SAMN05421688_3246 [Poseidonocella pacifica]
MIDKALLERGDLRRLADIANRTYDELIEIPTASPHLEVLIQALSEAADRLSAVTHEMLHPEEYRSISEGDEQWS